MKKRFAAKLSVRQHDSLTFFIDRSLGRYVVATRLRELGCQCVVHDDMFPQGTADAEWMAALAKRQWIVLTKDERIRYRPLELNALKTAGLRVFVLVAGNLRGVEMADVLASAVDRIIQAAHENTGPYLYYVRKDGSLRRIS